MKKQFKYWVASSIIILIICFFGGKDTKANSNSENLITIGGKTITSSMKIEDVKKMFGEPKLIASSYWGGSSYTFYGTGYSDYLYLETYSDGSIASYGSISEGFQTNLLSYGDKCDNTVRIGTEATDYEDQLFGLIRYTDSHSDAYEIFGKNIVENNRSICKHATEMWNAISYLYGDNTPTIYNETLFNINAQLAENGSDLWEYCSNTNRESFFKGCQSGTATMFPEYCYPNPLEFAKYAINYNCSTGYASAFIYTLKDKHKYPNNTIGFISPDILEKWDKIPYTEEEEELLKKVRERYKNSVDIFNARTSYYDIEPQYEQLPLIGGKLNKSVAIGAVEFLNSIRVGAGLNPLEYSEELSVAAQCKSTYIYYLLENGFEFPDPHRPPQIDGVDDAFYAECQKCINGENMYMCGYISTNIIGSLIFALGDSYSPDEFYSRGHRYNLLNPTWEMIGVGNTEQQGCQKMSGYIASDVDVVAWPSKGIMPAESGFEPKGMLTCKFYNGYFGTNTTTVEIKCLNNDRIWTIDPKNLSREQYFDVSGNMVSYRDDSISFINGGVYEITFKYLQNSQNEEVSYTYRTVYETAHLDDENGDIPKELNLSNSSIKINPGKMKKIKTGIMPLSAKNKRIYWQSTNNDIAVVNECGEVTAVSLGDTDIMAVTESGNLSAVCHVIVTDEIIEDSNEKDKNENGISSTPKPIASTNSEVDSYNDFYNNRKKKITISDVTLNQKSFVYNGKEKRPYVTVVHASLELMKDRDYTVSYLYNRDIGTAYVIVDGEGNYYGSVVKSFKIVPKGTNIKGDLKPKHKGFTIKWKKPSMFITGYQVQYSTSKKFKINKTVTMIINKKTITSLEISKLRAMEKYYVRVRTYNYKVSDGNKYYSKWSHSKTVITKQ